MYSHLAPKFSNFPLLSQICSSSVEHLGILFLYIFRTLDLDLPAEAENPAEEDMADGHPDDHPEGAHIAGVDGHICPKAVDDCIDHGVVADQFHLLTIATVHPEGGRKKIIDTEVRRDRYGFLRKNVRTGADTVHTEASDGLMLVRIAQYIVIIAVPDQTIGAEDVPFAVVAQLLLLSDVLGKVLEGNLLSGIDGLIDCIHDQQILSIFRLHPSLHGSVALQFLGLMLSGQRDNLGDHLLAAFF